MKILKLSPIMGFAILLHFVTAIPVFASLPATSSTNSSEFCWQLQSKINVHHREILCIESHPQETPSGRTLWNITVRLPEKQQTAFLQIERDPEEVVQEQGSLQGKVQLLDSQNISQCGSQSISDVVFELKINSLGFVENPKQAHLYQLMKSTSDSCHSRNFYIEEFQYPSSESSAM